MKVKELYAVTDAYPIIIKEYDDDTGEEWVLAESDQFGAIHFNDSAELDKIGDREIESIQPVPTDEGAELHIYLIKEG